MNNFCTAKNKLKVTAIPLLVLTLLPVVRIQSRDCPSGVLSLNLKDHSRGNRKIAVRIYFPDIPGISATAQEEDGENKFPVICFTHGYVMSEESYEPLCRMLTGEGYMVVFPCTELGMFPSHKNLAADIEFILESVGTLGSDPSSPLYNHVGPGRCLMGHSMGGGASYVAAGNGCRADAIVTFAAYNTKPSAIESASTIAIPALVFAGDNDCITPPERHQLPIYNSLASKSKTYILVKGGTHCNMGSISRKCNTAERMSGCHKGGLSLEEMNAVIRKYLLPWLRYYLKNDTQSGAVFDSELKAGTGIEYLQSEPLSATTDLSYQVPGLSPISSGWPWRKYNPEQIR